MRTIVIVSLFAGLFMVMWSSGPARADALPSCSQEASWRPPCEQKVLCVDYDPSEAGNWRFCTYEIPDDCSLLKRSDHWFMQGTMSSIRIGWALLNACERWELSSQKEAEVSLDFVSEIDWAEVAVEILPYGIGEMGIGGDSYFANRTLIAALYPDANLLDSVYWDRLWSSSIIHGAENKISQYQVQSPAGSGCVASGGRFTKLVTKSDGVYRCEDSDEHGSGYFFTDAIVNDFNHDGIQDVSVHIGETGSHSGTFSQRLELTRLSSNGTLIPLSELSVPFDCDDSPKLVEQAICEQARLRLTYGRIKSIERSFEQLFPSSVPPQLPEVVPSLAIACASTGEGASAANELDGGCLADALNGHLEGWRRALMGEACALRDYDC